MILGERIEARMRAANLSQAELARRVGVSQPTIYKLLRRSKKGSTHLHRIARELGTTPAYLSGETDDPDIDSQDTIANFEDRTSIERLRSIGKNERRLLDELALSLSKRETPTVGINLPSERALTAMFEALLAGINPSLPQDDKALLLAKRLPIALAQMQDLQSDPDTSVSEEPDASPAKRHYEPTR